MTATKNVAQRLFEANQFVQDYFDFYDEGTETFQPRPAIRVLYPDDQAFTPYQFVNGDLCNLSKCPLQILNKDKTTEILSFILLFRNVMILLLYIIHCVVSGPYGENSELPSDYCNNKEDPCHNFCEQFAVDEERLQKYARLWHHDNFVPYNIELSKDSFEITTALLLAQKNCLNQALAKATSIAKKLAAEDETTRRYRAAIWTKEMTDRL